LWNIFISNGQKQKANKYNLQNISRARRKATLKSKTKHRRHLFISAFPSKHASLDLGGYVRRGRRLGGQRLLTELGIEIPALTGYLA
jgi:hypothetical protein